MKTFAANEKRSAPAAHRQHHYVHHPMAPAQQAQREDIRLILRSTGAQTKLTIGQPNDKYEQEADRVADQVMAIPDPRLQRQPEKAEEEEILQTKPLADQITPSVQRQSGISEGRVEAQRERSAHQAATRPTSGIHSMKGNGQPLSGSSRSFMERRFGHDFNQVRVHTDKRAAESASSLRAKAFTLGQNIAFAHGHFAPGSTQGRRLLAHELTHVIQQTKGSAPNAVQRAEVDDRSCAGLTDIESDIDAKVNREIAAARTAVGTPIPTATLLRDVMTRLGRGAISPMERFVVALPATKRKIPPRSLSGTKYSGVGARNLVYWWQGIGKAHVVGSSAKIAGMCVGADKLGHFFQEGYTYYTIAASPGGTTARAERAGRALEITGQGLGVGTIGTGVYSNADLVANRSGLKFYQDLAANPGGLIFSIRNYISNAWNEQSNPSYYSSGEATVIWSNLLTGKWKGPFTSGSGSKAIDTRVDLSAGTAGTVTGTYEWPAASPTNTGVIKNGTVTQRTTTVSGTYPGSAAVSASPVTGISIEYDWEEVASTSKGKGRFDSTNEQTLAGTWGTGTSRTGGTWRLIKT
ncbi:MAG: DUF4157 domain-containing protein [Desulfobacteraceae bacterium]|nr:DUF4157 domain-containing protein [Desulfobacteraceae bacterium]